MKAMYSVYDRTGDCFDFCDDEETEHSLDYEAEHDRLRVWQWSAERQSCGENNQIIAEFYQPRRFIKDFTVVRVRHELKTSGRDGVEGFRKYVTRHGYPCGSIAACLGVQRQSCNPSTTPSTSATG
jgi:hypothetical protein